MCREEFAVAKPVASFAILKAARLYQSKHVSISAEASLLHFTRKPSLRSLFLVRADQIKEEHRNSCSSIVSVGRGSREACGCQTQKATQYGQEWRSGSRLGGDVGTVTFGKKTYGAPGG